MIIKYAEGQVYGRLTLLSVAECTKNRNKKWLCNCSCGNQTIVSTNHLSNGHTMSCGCIQQESRVTHGHSKTRIYKIWMLMRNRCGQNRTGNRKYYSGRGITVCAEWSNSFIEFREWAIKNGYSDSLTIDRIDNDLGYSPINCRWIPKGEQTRNLRRNIYLAFLGERKLLTDWAKQFNVSYNMVYSRFRKGIKGSNLFEPSTGRGGNRKCQ